MPALRSTCLVALCYLAQTSACATETSQLVDAAGLSEEAHSSPLCPDCAAVGGETGDFPGSGAPGVVEPAGPACASVRADEQLVLPSGLSAASAIAFVQREVELPATWRNTAPTDVPLWERRPTSGFSEHTGITIDLQVTEIWRRDFISVPDSESTPAMREACDGIDLKAIVSLRTADGAITGTFDSAIVHVSSESDAELKAWGDISQFTGGLQLDARPGDSLLAHLSIFLKAGIVRGAFVPYLQSPAGPNGYYDNEDNTPETFWPLELHWPGTDHCNFYSFPYTGMEAAERVAEAIPKFRATSPYSGVYLEPTWGVGDPRPLGETELTLDFDNPGVVCESGVFFPSPALDFELPTRVSSSDGRYDLSVPLRVSAIRLEAGDLGIAKTSFDSGLISVGAFQGRFAISGLDFGGDQCAQLRVEYYLESNSEFAKLFQIISGPCDVQSPSRRVVELLGQLVR